MLKGKLGWILRIAITIGLFVVMFAFFVDVDELILAIRQVHPSGCWWPRPSRESASLPRSCAGISS